MMNTLPDVIIFDTNGKTCTVVKAVSSTEGGPTCDCLDSQCYTCIPEKMRKLILQLYNSYPLVDSPRIVYGAIAHFTGLPVTLVSRLFKLHHQVLNPFNKRKPKPPFYCVEPTVLRLLPMELCNLRWQLLSCKPKQFANLLQQICSNYRHKIKSANLVSSLFASKSLKLRRIRHKVSNKPVAVLMEERSLRVRRLEFIQRVRKIRADGRQIIYINEIAPDERNKRKLILVVACVDGPIVTTYIESITISSAMRWLRSRVLSQINEPSVFVFAESSIFQAENAPTMSDSKSVMKNWLRTHDIAFDEDLLKIELFGLIRRQLAQRTAPRYSLDVQLKNEGHEVLHIPSESADLNPLDYIFLNIRFKATSQGSTSFDLNKELYSIPNELWRIHFHQANSAERNYLTIEENFEATQKHYHIDNAEFVVDDRIYTNNVVRH